MKKNIPVFLIILIIIWGCSQTSKLDKTQNLTGTLFEDGRNLTADVIFKNGSIVNIVVSNVVSNDTNPEDAAQKVAYEIISKQSLSVDRVTDAEKTSNDVIKAVALALKSGGISSDLFMDNDALIKKDSQMKSDYDVIVIGSGAAGLSAAIQAALNDNTVLVLEKMPIAGGSTYLSGAEISLPENVLNIDQSQDDNPEKMIADIVKTSQYTADRNLVSIISYNIADTVLWLQQYVGSEFHNDFYMVNGHSIPRITFPDGGGAALINKMIFTAEKLGVQILYNTSAIRLIKNNLSIISGVETQNGDKRIIFNASQRVIIATGGFSANKSMCEKNNHRLKEMDILSSGPQGNTGDGITMGIEVGAAVVDMQNIQLYPYTNPATGIHFYMDNRRIDGGALYINREGKRFIREDLTRSIVAPAVLKQTESTMYEVFNQGILDQILVNELAQKEFNQWVYQGVIAKGETIGECAEVFSLSKKEVIKTLNRYNALIKNGKDEDFGREMDYPMLNKGPYYMLEGVPSIHYTLGGLKIDEQARVLDQDDNPIPRLYAAGEVTGGIFGKDRLGACAVPDALVFGRIAGGWDLNE